jgi:isochorismate pyruvate lyase
MEPIKHLKGAHQGPEIDGGAGKGAGIWLAAARQNGHIAGQGRVGYGNACASCGQDTMTPRAPTDCKDMTDVRAEIDRVDQALVDLIGERMGYVERAWQIKLTLKQEANVPWRNQQVIDRVRTQAKARGVPPDLCEALWRQMIGWFIQYEEEKLRDQIEES